MGPPLPRVGPQPLVLLGPGQVGKSAVIQEYLYRMIAAEEKPVREIWLISPQRMISGMSFVGQWESAQSNELRGNDYQ